MFGEEPYLEIVRADDIADQQIVCAVVARVGCGPGWRPDFFQNDLQGFQRAGALYGNLLPRTRRPRNHGHFRDVGRHRDADAAQKLDTLRNGVHQFQLAR